MELIDALDRSFDHAHKVILGIGPERRADPTPCAEWDVNALLAHTIGTVAGIGAAARGDAPGRRPDDFALSDDPASQFRTAADGALAAWRLPGVFDRVVDAGAGPMPGRVLAGINFVDTSTHSWDLAKATGQDPALADDVADLALELAHQIVTPEVRAGRFAAEVAVPPDAPATDRLVAFLGRQP